MIYSFLIIDIIRGYFRLNMQFVSIVLIGKSIEYEISRNYYMGSVILKTYSDRRFKSSKHPNFHVQILFSILNVKSRYCYLLSN